MDYLRRFFASHGWLIGSSGAQAIAAVAGMISNLLYANYLPISEVGLLAVGLAASNVGSVGLDRGYGTWVTRTVPRGLVDVYSATRILFRAALPGGVGCCALFFASFLFEPSTVMPQFALTVGILAPSIWLFQCGVTLAQASERIILRNVAIISNGVLTLAFTTVFLAISADWFAAVVASAAAYIVVGFIAIMASLSRIPGRIKRFSPPRTVVRKEARAMFIHVGSTYLLANGDVLVAGAVFSPSIVGLYQVARKCAQAVSLPLISSLPVFLARVSAMSYRRREQDLSRVILLSGLLFSLAVLATAVFGRGLLGFAFGSAYSEAAFLTAVLIVAFQMQFQKDALAAVAIATGRIKKAIFANASSAVALVAIGFCSSYWIELSVELYAAGLAFAFAVGALINLTSAGKSRRLLVGLLSSACASAFVLIATRWLQQSGLGIF